VGVCTRASAVVPNYNAPKESTSDATVPALVATACVVALGVCVCGARKVCGDGKVANRDIRVWHGATETGP
jgi:hypothetical protein